MKPAALLRLSLTLLLLVFTGALFADPAAEPVPYKRTAHFGKRYDPTLVPDHVAQLARPYPVTYPAKWRKWDQPAFATIECLILATGMPDEVQCTEATDQAFAREAVKAVERTIFIPALKNQQGVCSKIVLPLKFMSTKEKKAKAKEIIEAEAARAASRTNADAQAPAKP